MSVVAIFIMTVFYLCKVQKRNITHLKAERKIFITGNYTEFSPYFEFITDMMFTFAHHAYTEAATRGIL